MISTVFNSKKFIKDVNDHTFEIEYKRKKKLGLRGHANEIGISAPTLSRVLNGKSFDLETFFKLCKWMGKYANRYQL